MRQIGLLILLLGCGGDAQSGAPAAAEAELVREAVESLDAAFKSGDRGAGTRGHCSVSGRTSTASVRSISLWLSTASTRGSAGRK